MGQASYRTRIALWTLSYLAFGWIKPKLLHARGLSDDWLLFYVCIM